NRRLLSELPRLPVCEGPAGAAIAASPDDGTGGQVERTDCPPVSGGKARAALGAARRSRRAGVARPASTGGSLRSTKRGIPPAVDRSGQRPALRRAGAIACLIPERHGGSAAPRREKLFGEGRDECRVIPYAPEDVEA